MNSKQIDKLLVKISQGDNSAFEELYLQTKKGVFSFLYSYFRNYENTEDAMQTVYLQIKLNIAQYRHGTNGSAWILQIAKNRALNDLNRMKRVEYTDEIEVSVPPKPAGEITELMQKTLTEEEQRIVVLHVLWGYKHREIAEQLSCPTGTVTSKYKRSITKLKEALKEKE